MRCTTRPNSDRSNGLVLKKKNLTGEYSLENMEQFLYSSL
jgi:hypothetical protein